MFQMLTSTIHLSILVTSPTNALKKDVLITYFSFTNMFRLLSRSSSGLLSRLLGIQTSMLKCKSEPHKYIWIPNVLVSYLDDDCDSKRNILLNE